MVDRTRIAYKRTHVNYYELLGERVNVDSFALMVRSVARKLYELDSNIIERMARNHEKLYGWINPVLSYEKNEVKRPVKLLNDKEIYISTGYSAYDCISFIRGLLRKYELNIDEDFIYSARTTRANNTTEDGQ